MKTTIKIAMISLLFTAFTTIKCQAQEATKPVAIPELGVSYPWTNSQLLEPADLAGIIRSGNKKAVILNIGAVEDIQGARHIGAVSKSENMEQLQKALADLPKNTTIVIYCGCCPFTKCPNIRPAFQLLSKQGFTHIKVLNLPVNLQTNWISKGYPIVNH